MATSVRSRKSLSLKEKVRVINEHEIGGSVRSLAAKFKIGKTQVFDIIKNKYEILRLFRENSSSDRVCRFIRSGPGEVIDRTVFEWYNRVKATKKIQISGTMVKEKAQEVAKQMNADSFKASNGWLDRFKSRHGISFKSIDRAQMNDWESKMEDIIKGYDWKDVYNADEMGLFYRAPPDSGAKDETCSGGNLATERITVLLCANIIGEKEKSLVIGESMVPSSFKSIRLDTDGVVYRSNPNSWMTSAIMKEWLEGLNRRMKSQKRKILLFLDNTTSHVHLDLECVKLVFFPTSNRSPMEQGVLKSLKNKYRQHVLRHFIANAELNTTQSPTLIAKRIDVLKAMGWIQKSWTEVTPATIVNSFRKAGFPDCRDQFGAELEENVDTELGDLLKIMQVDTDAATYTAIDDNLNTESSSEDLSAYVNCILNSVSPKAGQSIIKDGSQGVQDAALTLPGNQFKTHAQALEALNSLSEFYRDRADEKCFDIVNQLITCHEQQMISLNFN